MPDPLSILRLAALLAFIGLVALALWLLDVAWWVVPPVMAVALFIAWTIEWLAWRGSMTTITIVRETEAPPPAPPAPQPMELPPTPVEAIMPPAPEPAPEPEPQAQPVPQPEPQPVPEPEPTPGPEPTPAPEPVKPTAVEPSPPPEKPPREPRRPRRMRLRPVPAPRPAPVRQDEHEPAPAPEAPSVVTFRPRVQEPRSWNLWDLERIAREAGREHPERRDEWSYLFLNLRQFAHADGSLPAEFDSLVRESFAGLLERSPGA